MRVSFKLTFVLILAVTATLTLHAGMRVLRESTRFERDLREDHRDLGNSLGVVMTSVTRHQGKEEAVQLLDAIDLEHRQVQFRWTTVARLREADRSVSADVLKMIAAGILAQVEHGQSEDVTLHTYLPLPQLRTETGDVPVLEAMETVPNYARTTIWGTVVLTVLLAIVCSVVTLVMGIRLLGRPLTQLSWQARRIGAGDLSTRIGSMRNDELGELARTMDAMCDSLVKSREDTGRETKARYEALEQLRHADRLATVGKLASGIAHELGTPLNVVATRASMIADQQVTGPDAVRSGRIIAEQSAWMAQVIGQLMDFAHPSPTGKMVADVREIATQTVAMLQPVAKKNGSTLILESGPNPAIANVSLVQIQQVLANLVMNAIQAMPTGGLVHVRVLIEEMRRPENTGGPPAAYVCVRVEDEGEGIAEEIVPHLFDPFFSTKGVGRGTGLGLSVVHGIVRDHGGWIQVQSERGSRFDVFLPMEMA